MVSVWFHTVILDLWRPPLDTFNFIRLRSVPTFATRWLVIVYEASARQLQHLVYLYRRRFELTNPTMLVTHGYKYLLNEVIGNSEAPEAQLHFTVALRGYMHLAQWSYAMCGIARAFFRMGVRAGIIHRFGAEAMQDEIQRAAVSLGGHVEYSSSYPIDLELADADVEGGSMESLANEFRRVEVQESDAREADANQRRNDGEPVWRGVREDLDLTLSEAPGSDDLLSWGV